MTMRAMVLSSPGALDSLPLQAEDVAKPRPGPDELLLRVEACAVCRTDLQIVEGDLAARRLPIVPGHQVAGVVEALGSEVSGWSVGDRAGVGWLAGACGACKFCLSGRENLCLDASFTGWDRDGGYAAFMTVRAAFAVRIPPTLEPAAAAPLLCGGVIGYRSLKRSGIQPGGRLGLFGYGASARLTIQVARHWGCEVYVCTRSQREQDRARHDGATWAGGYAEAPPALLDAAITFAPAGSVVAHAVHCLDRGGVVAINAIHLDHLPEMDYDRLWWEREIRSVANFTRRDAEEFIALAAEIPVRTEIETYDLAAANQALRHHAAGDLTKTAVLTP
ncbi:MAG TPA: zinc-dependent alcohol dehydrogenase family protein [Dehalococcoidia bacterium]